MIDINFESNKSLVKIPNHLTNSLHIECMEPIEIINESLIESQSVILAKIFIKILKTQ